MSIILRTPKLASAGAFAAEIAAFGGADLLRLAAIARLRARGFPGLDGADLLDEAMLRLLDAAEIRRRTASTRRPPTAPAGTRGALLKHEGRRT